MKNRRKCQLCGIRPMPDQSKTRKSRCHTCDKRIERANNPIRAKWNMHRDHARERGREFTISFEQFANAHDAK
jgi:hypothetical protein